MNKTTDQKLAAVQNGMAKEMKNAGPGVVPRGRRYFVEAVRAESYLFDEQPQREKVETPQAKGTEVKTMDAQQITTLRRRLCEAKDLYGSWATLAAALHCSKATVTRLHQGTPALGVDTYLSIAAAINKILDDPEKVQALKSRMEEQRKRAGNSFPTAAQKKGENNKRAQAAATNKQASTPKPSSPPPKDWVVLLHELDVRELALIDRIRARIEAKLV